MGTTESPRRIQPSIFTPTCMARGLCLGPLCRSAGAWEGFAGTLATNMSLRWSLGRVCGDVGYKYVAPLELGSHPVGGLQPGRAYCADSVGNVFNRATSKSALRFAGGSRRSLQVRKAGRELTGFPYPRASFWLLSSTTATRRTNLLNCRPLRSFAGYSLGYSV